MRSITPTLTVAIRRHCGKQRVWQAPPFPVNTYRELVEHVARLSFANADDLLFFRGQDKDYQSKAGGTSLYPGIYRGDNVPMRELRHRFELLDQASHLLVDAFKARSIEGHIEMSRKRYMQWSILQHYEVVPTALLDLSQSLRVACSFAQLKSSEPECVVYAIGLPFLMGRIAINSEHDIVNVRLLSICPPNALRPYFQEGFVAGTTDITTDYDPKTELDFRNRLIAKFAIPRAQKFWGTGFDAVPESALYPSGDSIKEVCDTIKQELKSELVPGALGVFIQYWAVLENQLMEEARRISERNVSIREAITVLERSQRLSTETGTQIERLRRVRNQAVHSPNTVQPDEIAVATDEVKEILQKWHLKGAN